MTKQFARKGFVFLLAAIMTFTMAGNMAATPVQALTPAQESAATGAGPCDFASGVSVGLAVGGLFGCLLCSAGSLTISAAQLLLCKEAA